MYLNGPSIAIADFDGDGVPDLAVAEPLTILKGKGDGEFSSVFSYGFAAGMYPLSLAVADFNRDGKPDVAVLLFTNLQGQIQIFTGNGDGTLTAGVVLPVPATMATVGVIAAADFNGDGIIDLAATAQSGVWVWLGKGDGTFSSPTSYTFPGALLSSLALGDFNRDGKTDIAVADESDGNITILPGKGDGTFSPGTVIPVSVPYGAAGLVLGPGNLVAGDFNGDNALDLAVTLINPAVCGGGIAILAGKGDGTFQSPAIDPEHAVAIAIADINGDKIPDLVVADYFQGTVVRIGNGDGTFQPATLVFSTQLQGFAIADFNKDGTLDVAGSLDAGGIAVLLNLSLPPQALVVVSAASFAPGPLAPDSIASAFGRDLATLAAPAGTAVTIQDSAGAKRQATLFYVSPGQVNFLIPAATAIGAATVTVSSGDGAQTSAPIQIMAVAPSLFTEGSAGIAAAYAVRVSPQGAQTILPVFTVQAGTVVLAPIDLSQPGEVYLILFGTGFDAAAANSAIADIQGVNAPVVYAGLQPSFPGLDQLNVQLPPSLAGSGVVSAVLTIGGQQANRVYVAVQ